MSPFLQQYRDRLLELARNNHIQRIRVFGSMVREDAVEESDVDLLVDLEPGADGLDQGGFQIDAQELLGRKVDVVTVNSIHPLIRDKVLREAQPL